jgi:hypothetical protein
MCAYMAVALRSRLRVLLIRVLTRVAMLSYECSQWRTS